MEALDCGEHQSGAPQYSISARLRGGDGLA
jgi:hypothetical protein